MRLLRGGARRDADFGGETAEERRGLRFRHSISPVGLGVDVLRQNDAVTDTLTKEVGPQVDVLAGIERGGVL